MLIVFVFLGVVGSADVIKSEKEKALIKPNLYAVVVGVGELKTQALTLKNAEADTLLFGRTLERNAKGLFSKVNIIYLNQEDETTKEAILQELNSLQNISKNDLFVFYATSFAKIIDTNYYLVTSNTQSMSDSDVLQGAISRNELIKVFAKIPAKNKLLLFDTCYSSIAIDLKSDSIQKLNIASISASNSKKTALKIHLNSHSVFANVVSDAIAGEADIDGDGIVQSSEFIKYVFNTASVEVAKLDYEQMPAYYQAGDGFNITSSKEVEPTATAMVEKIEPKIVAIKPQTFKKKEIKKVKINIDRFNFIVDDSSIFMDVKREIKRNFRFTNDKGENLIVFEFYTNRFMKHTVKNVETEKISQIKIGYHGDSFRVVLYVKTKTAYDYKVTKEGLLITLK